MGSRFSSKILKTKRGGSCEGGFYHHVRWVTSGFIWYPELLWQNRTINESLSCGRRPQHGPWEVMDLSLIVFKLWCHGFGAADSIAIWSPGGEGGTASHSRYAPHPHTPTWSLTRQRTHTLAPIGAFTSAHADFPPTLFGGVRHLLATPVSLQVRVAETHKWCSVLVFSAVSFR